jgi:hypothetical protein
MVKDENIIPTAIPRENRIGQALFFPILSPFVTGSLYHKNSLNVIFLTLLSAHSTGFLMLQFLPIHQD